MNLVHAESFDLNRAFLELRNAARASALLTHGPGFLLHFVNILVLRSGGEESNDAHGPLQSERAFTKEEGTWLHQGKRSGRLGRRGETGK